MDDAAIVMSTVRARMLADLDSFLEATQSQLSLAKRARALGRFLNAKEKKQVVVKAHSSHSKKGKTFNVRQHSREQLVSVEKARKIADAWRERVWGRKDMTMIANQAIKGRSLSKFHPGNITVYRGWTAGAVSHGRGGTSWTKSLAVAKRYADVLGVDKKHQKIYALKLNSSIPAIDVNKLLSGRSSKSSRDREVFIAPGVKPKLMEASVIEATQLVRAYARVRKGKRQYVRQYNREVNNAKIVGATPNEEKYIRELLSRHDPKVIKSVSSFAVMDRKDFNKMITKHTKDTQYQISKSELRDVLAWYDEKKAFIVINRSNMVRSTWKSTLDHELGHAAFYHSSKWDTWFRPYDNDTKFDRFTWYSKTNGAEAFAESYMAYSASNGKAKNSRYKRVFDIVRTVVSAVNPKDNWNKSGGFDPNPDPYD